jgi:hypothetical protein
MSSNYKVTNEGAGADLLLTFEVDSTANQDFTQTDLENGLCAAVITGDNKVGMGTAGGRLVGKVIKVSEELQSGTAVPAFCTVQVTGVARFKYVATTPAIGNKMEVDGAGKVRQATTSTDVPAGGTKHRGLVIAVITADTTCDVLLDA